MANILLIQPQPARVPTLLIPKESVAITEDLPCSTRSQAGVIDKRVQVQGEQVQTVHCVTEERGGWTDFDVARFTPNSLANPFKSCTALRRLRRTNLRAFPSATHRG